MGLANATGVSLLSKAGLGQGRETSAPLLISLILTFSECSARGGGEGSGQKRGGGLDLTQVFTGSFWLLVGKGLERVGSW